VVSNYLDHANFMTTEQLKTMVAAGMAIGCHSRSHPYLTSVGGERAWDEIAGAKAILEADGFKIDTFAYPTVRTTRGSSISSRAPAFAARGPLMAVSAQPPTSS
jgi:peptidoglycan/xylan/chitin deacetylase (PgdA/CDA1 family)